MKHIRVGVDHTKILRKESNPPVTSFEGPKRKLAVDPEVGVVKIVPLPSGLRYCSQDQTFFVKGLYSFKIL